MASGTRRTNTQVEALQSLLQEITSIKTMPDADVPWLISLETQILQKIREPFEAAAQQMGAPMEVMAGMGGQMGQMGGGGMGAMGEMPLSRGMSTQRPQPPPVDELRRMMNQ